MAHTLTQSLTGTKSDGTPSAVVYPCVIQGMPRRSIGLGGDNLAVSVKRAEGEDTWPPADWDLERPITVVFGYVGTPPDADELVELECYLVQDTPAAFGVNDGTAGALGGAGTSVAQEHGLLLCTALGVYEDGRGGRLRLRTFNPLREDGTVDTDHEDYRTHSELVALCIEAMGLIDDVVDASIDEEPDGGPYDWGNANPKHELDALLARIGYAAVVGYANGVVHVFRLPKTGEDMTPPSWITDNAEPYALTKARAVRGTTVIVTSGRTRTIEVTTRTNEQLELVWRDPRTGRWLNDEETLTANGGPGGTQPGDLAALNAGPTDRSRAAMAQHRRLFGAARAADPEDFARTRRLVALPITAYDAATNQMAKSAALVEAQGVVKGSESGADWRSEPESGAGLSRVDGVRVHPLDGVFEWPGDFMPVRFAPGKTTGAAGDFLAIGPGQFRLTFAHEANNGEFREDYYVRVFRGEVDGTTGLVKVVAVEDDEEIDEAFADPFAVWIEAPFLRRVVQRDADGVATPVNDLTLNAAAEKIALVRAAAEVATTGVIELRGIFDAVPGYGWAWATSIAWDLARRRTIVTVGSHEVPQGFFDAIEADAGRSFAAGLSRFGPEGGGSSAALSDVRNGSSPASAGGPGAGARSAAEITASPATRGAEATAGDRPSTGGDAPLTTQRGGAGEVWGRITGAADIGANRWEYDWEAVSPTNAGGWEPVATPRTSATMGKARNLLEVGNTSTGVQGNGVDVANLTGGFTVRPVATGTVHAMRGPTGPQAAAVWWFSSPNGVDGACGP